MLSRLYLRSGIRNFIYTYYRLLYTLTQVINHNRDAKLLTARYQSLLLTILTGGMSY